MTVRGKVVEGVIVLDKPGSLPEGAEVEVAWKPCRGSGKAGGKLAEKLRDWGGFARGLPRDFARQHDHYLYGTPKQ